MAMLSPKASTPANKFEYVTRLVTQHEQQVTQNQIHVSELLRKVAEVEQKQAVELGMLAMLRDRPILHELETLRKDADSAHKRMDQLLEDQRQDTRALQLGLLQTEVDRMKTQAAQLVDAQASIHQSLRDLVMKESATSKAALMEALRAELGAVASELRAEMGAVRQESSAAAHSVEAATMTVNSLAIKVRTHMGASGAALSAVSSRVEGQQNSVEGLASNICHLEQDTKKIKKHVVKLERQVEGLQTLGQVAVATEKGVAEVRREVEQATAAVREMREGREISTAGSDAALRGLARRVDRSEARAAAASDLAGRTRTELGAMGEALQGVLQQVMEVAKRANQQVATPPSYLSNLLGPFSAPPMPNLTAARAQLAGWPPMQPPMHPTQHTGYDTTQSQPDVWDVSKTEFGQFLQGFRHTQGHAPGQSATSTGIRLAG